MKNKKILKTLAALTLSAMAAGCIAAAGCTEEHSHTWSDKWESNAEGHWHVATCEGHTDIKSEIVNHVWDDDNDTDCNTCGYVRTIAPAEHTHDYKWVDNGDGTHSEKCDVAGCDTPVKAEKKEHEWGEDGKCTKCGAEKPEEVKATVSLTFEKRSVALNETVQMVAVVTPADTAVTWKSSDDTVATVDDKGVVTGKKVGKATITAAVAGGAEATCEVTVKETIEYDEVVTACDLTALWTKFGNKNKLTEPFEFGKFTFSAGVYFDSTGDITGNTVNNQKKDIYFNLTGYGNSNVIQFDGKGASSPNTPTFSLYNEKGEKVWELQIQTVTKGITIDNLPAGYYKLSSDAAARIGNISILEKLEKSAPVSITVKNPTVKMLAGRELPSTSLEVTLDYDNGRHDAITDFTINKEGFDATQAGKQKVTVEYTVAGAEAPYTADVEVLVYAIESIKVSDHSAASTRVTMPVQKIFKVGEVFNSKYAAVTATCSIEGVDGKEEFILTSSEYTLTEPATGAAGKQTVHINANGKTASYYIYVVETQGVETTQVIVDASATEVTLDPTSKVYTVMTVNQAIQLLKAVGAADDVEKVITVKNGEYKEKVEIDLPNVTLKGEGTDASKNVLWYDLIAGFKDPSGTTAWSTDGSASVSIRSSAYGFHAENIMFKNYWNTNALYIESTKLHGDTQAVALLVQSDMTTFKNCRFSSYHDTLYAMEGRHLFEDCYIEGRTDYIFGATATSYFKNCTIHTIGSGDSKNGGYVVATKGSGEGGMKYGYIFYGCTLEGDNNVTDGTVSLARGWDKGMTLAFINCDISKAYSIEAFGEKTAAPADQPDAKVDDKNDRYGKMNAAPNPNQLFEYNNTGAGALTAEILAKADPTTHVIPDMCTVLTAEQAAAYADLAEVFTKDNGNVKYKRAWNGIKQVVEPTIDYNFGEENMGTAYEGKTTTDENGIDLFDGAMTIYAQNGASFHTENNKNFLWLSDGCVIKMNIAGEFFIDPYGGDYGTSDNIHIYYVNGKAVAVIKETETSKFKNGALCAKTMSLDKLSSPVHEHQWSEWEITTMPTPETKGEAKRVCTDCELETAASQTVELPEVTLENYTATPSKTPLKVIYTYESEYGPISAEGDPLPGLHVHDYGAWVYNAETGKVTKTCGFEGGECDAKTVEVEVPALTDANYTITNNTATLEEGGTGTYTITIDGEVISFTAATPKLEVTRMTETTTWQYAGTDDPVGTEYVLFVGCANSGGWAAYGKGGYVALNLPEGATLEFERSPYETCDKMKINGVEQKAAKGEKVTYVVKVPGYVILSADSTCYFKSLTVTIDPAYRHTQHYFGEWNITAIPTTETVGSATRSCLVPDCGLTGVTQTKELPVLSETAYSLKPSETAGKSIYTLRADTTISFEADTLEGLHVHDYGEWVIAAPTAEATGTATKTCKDDNCPDEPVVVELPALTDAKYVITNNTATVEAAGTGTYTITIGEGEEAEEISFTAATPKIELATISLSKELSAASISATNKEIYLKGITVQDNKYWVFGTGAQIKFFVEEGAVLTFYCDYWGGGIVVTGCGNGKLTDLDAQHKSYTATTAGMITIDLTAGATQAGYLRTINVSYALKTAAAGYYYAWSDTGLTQGTPVNSPDRYLEFTGCKANGDWLKYGGAGSSIKLKVAAGSTLRIQASEWDAGAKINGVAATEDANHLITYVVPGEGEVEVELTSPDGSSYIKSIYVVKVYAVGEAANLASYHGAELKGTNYIHEGVAIDTTESTAKYKDNNGNIQLGVGTVLTIEIAAGAKIEIEWYNAAQPKYGSDENATVVYENGKAVITIKASDGTAGGTASSIYIKSIKVVAAAA